MQSTDTEQENESSVLTQRRTAEAYQRQESESLSKALPEGIRQDGNVVIEKTVKYFPIYLNIINGAIWGVIARRLLNKLTAEGSYLSGVVWANFTACFVMGLSVDSVQVWSTLVKEGLYGGNKGAIPLYVGITTGFCGTCSSFLSFILDIFNFSVDTVHSTYPSFQGRKGFIDFCAVLLAQIGLSTLGFLMGKHMIGGFDEYIPKMSHKVYKAVEIISMAIGFGIYVASIVLAGVEKGTAWREWMFSIIFAPPGAILRFYASKYLNGKLNNFPFGTFIVNVFGSILLATFTLLQRGVTQSQTSSGFNSENIHYVVPQVIGCTVLSGLEDGFCGALTTVSTFVVELNALKVPYAYRYAIISIFLSIALVYVELGTFFWTGHVMGSNCKSR